MKTTIELSEGLFHSSKELASKSQTIIRALVEDGLLRMVNDAQVKTIPAFKILDVSVRGKELLISDPQKWQQLEHEHLGANLR